MLPRYLTLLSLCLLGTGLISCGDSPGEKAADKQEKEKKDGGTGGAKPDSLAKIDKGAPKDAFSKQLEAFTGGHTRAVWMQHMHPKAKDTYATGKTFYLAGIDSRDGKGVREIISKKGNYSRPMVTPDGGKIVYTKKITTKKDGKKHYTADIYVVGWDGKNPKKLQPGYAVDVWRDPASGKDWVYAGNRIESSGQIDLVSKKLIRFPLGDPSRIETVWDETAVGLDNIQLSRDGTHAGCLFPWPHAGLLNIAEKKWTKYSNGCWTSFAPDNSYVSWIFDGAHRNLMLYTKGGKQSWSVNLSKGASKEGYEVYHPRWSNHVRYMAMSGPYRVGKGVSEKDVGRLGQGGQGVEIFLGKFADDLKKMDGFFQLTDNEFGNFYPDLWVAAGDTVDLDPKVARSTGNGAEQNPTTGKEWPLNRNGLLFKWDNMKSENTITLPDGKKRVCRLVARGGARVYRNYEMDLAGGHCEPEEEVWKAVQKSLAAAKDWSMEFAFSVADGEKFVTRLHLGNANRAPNQHSEVAARIGPKSVALDFHDKQLVFSLESPLTSFTGHHFALVSKGEELPALYLDGVRLENPEVSPARRKEFVLNYLRIGALRNPVRVDQVALYGRALEPQEVKAHFGLNKERTKHYEYGESIRVSAKLTEVTPSLPEARIQPYPRALAVYTYEVLEQTGGALKSGELKIGESINVAHWTYLDRKMLPGFPRQAGEKVTLSLEAYEDHPFLSTQRLNNGDVDVLLPFFYDVEVPISFPRAPVHK